MEASTRLTSLSAENAQLSHIRQINKTLLNQISLFTQLKVENNKSAPSVQRSTLPEWDTEFSPMYEQHLQSVL